MKVLIYGHSQSQPTGMGDDLVAALKKLKVQNKRLGLQGRSDKALLAEVGKLGNVSGFDRVVLYCGGNNSTIPDTIKLINHFGAQRVTAVLPPMNVDRTVPNMTLEQRREHAAAYREAIKPLVPVFQIEGHAADFKKDEIHLRSGTAIGKDLAQKLLENLGLPANAASTPEPAPAASGSNIGLIVGIGAAAVLAFALWRARR